MAMFTRENLHRTLSSLGISEPGNIFEELKAEYTSADRAYHSDTHVSECLRHLQSYVHLAKVIPEIEIAIWFHDAIYDTKKSDNEELSAEWAVRYLSEKRLNSESIARIEDMILCTKTHEASSSDAVLMLDIDLGILGTPTEVFERYDQDIRREYQWIPEQDYKAGRAQVLTTFLERDTIYKNKEIAEKLEHQARVNLSRKIEELSI
jgi:predicted metal-dependent HD superfamily phosphohydrolase